jgi:beta-lactamase superfamily II metal-dependent hydrolase
VSIFRLTMHQASEGDALTLAWGANEATLHHALIDLGRTADYRALAPELRRIGRFEVFVMTHVDADHIEGAMPLVRERTAPFQPADVWFNGYSHLVAAKARLRHPTLETAGAKQGDKLSRGIRHFDWPWNKAFGGDPVSLDSPTAKKPIMLPGELAITLLSPGDTELAAMEPIWARELASANMRPDDPDAAPAAPSTGLQSLAPLDVEALARAPFREDPAEPNGTSIAFLAEFDGRRVLLGADAHPGVLARALRGLGYGPDNRLRLDLLKLPHHGSKANLSPELLSLIDCTHFAISTDGSRHGHPDREAIARLLVTDEERPKTLYFNAAQPSADLWNNATLKKKWAYATEIAPSDRPGIVVDIPRKPR